MRYIFIALVSSFILSACTKEFSGNFVVDPNDPGNDTTWKISIADDTPVNQLLETLQDEPQTDSFDATEGGTLEFDNSLEITFPPSSCTGAGAGMVKVEVIFLQKKGDMIRYERPTTSNEYLLETGGALDIRVSQNSIPLQLAPGKFITIKYKDQQPNSKMSVFYGDSTISNTINFTWLPALTNTGSAFLLKDSTEIAIGYQLLADRFRWINCDYFTDSSNVATNITAQLPLNFTNNNTAVFAVFKDQRIVAGLKGDFEHRLFTAKNIPVGSNIIIVSISLIGEDLYLGVKGLSVSANPLIELTPEKKTEKEIRDYLDSL